MNTLNKTLALIALASSSAAFAAVDFNELDIDGSGTLSQQEASMGGITSATFSELDTDGNGELSKQEFDNA